VLDITDAQWEFIEPLLPRYRRRKDGRGRPRKDLRAVLSGIFWILRTGAQWQELPRHYPPYQTCHRYFQEWSRNGTIERILHALAEDLYERGGIDISEAFIDGTFAGAKKGALPSERPSGGRAQRSWRSQTALVFLSPPGLQVLRHMRSRSSKRRSTPAFSSTHPIALLATELTTVIRSISGSATSAGSN
jgi:transposase